MKLYHGTNYSSAINIMTNGIDIKYSKKYLDFGPGFYTTPDYGHAVITAIRNTDKLNNKYRKNEKPYIVMMEFALKEDTDIAVGRYVDCRKRWGRFVLNNRLKKEILEEYDINEHNHDGRYDICYGEIADGNIVNIAYQINIGNQSPWEIDFRNFLKKRGKPYPLQYSFHTQKGYSCIKLLSCDTIAKEEQTERR